MTTKRELQFTIVIPAYNEEKNIVELINRTSSIITKLGNWDYELIFVNDDSADNSEKILITFKKHYSKKENKLLKLSEIESEWVSGISISIERL